MALNSLTNLTFYEVSHKAERKLIFVCVKGSSGRASGLIVSV